MSLSVATLSLSLLALAGAAPSADADAQYLVANHALPVAHHVAPVAHAVTPVAHAVAPVAHAVAPVAYTAGPAPNCVTEDVILITQVCTPNAEQVCSTETIDTQEIEYEKICQDIVDTICDAPVAHIAPYHHVKREAEPEAEADAQYFTHGVAPLVAGPVAHHVAPVAHHVTPVVHQAAPLPVAHAVAHSVTETVKHACREVTTEHCVDNPKIIEVPVEVEHCHTVTKVTCQDVENKLPKTTCEAVVTTQTHHAALAAPVHPVATHHVGYGYGK